MSLFDSAVSAGGSLARTPWKTVKRLFRLRVIMPRTLFGRSLLIIVLPVLLTQAITAVYFYRQHWEHMTSRLAYAVAGELALVIEIMETGHDPEARDALFDQVARSTELTLTFQPGERLEARPRVPGHWILQGRTGMGHGGAASGVPMPSRHRSWTDGPRSRFNCATASLWP